MSVTKRIKTPDGTIIHTLDGKFHNYDGPAIIPPKGSGKKDEYYIFGFKKTKDQFLEYKKDQKGLPPAKNPLFKTYQFEVGMKSLVEGTYTKEQLIVLDRLKK